MTTKPFDESAPLGLIDPIDLLEEHIIGRQLVGIVLLGIFNPMGPTLIPISLISDEESGIACLLVTSLNPFNQTRQLVARLADDLESLKDTLPLLARSHSGCIPKSLPTLMVYPTTDENILSYTIPSTEEFIEAMPLNESLTDTVADYQNHPGDPWARIPSFGEMLKKGREKRDNPIATPTGEDWDAWYRIMKDPNHIGPEFNAIIQSWSGSIQNVGAGMPHMPIEEAAAEITALGFPFFS